MIFKVKKHGPNLMTATKLKARGLFSEQLRKNGTTSIFGGDFMVKSDLNKAAAELKKRTNESVSLYYD